jgi:hypothetical protein
MRNRFTPGLVGLALFASAMLASAEDVRLHLRFGTREHPLEGRRYETMRALSHYLDERAQHAASQAIDDAHHGSGKERSFVDSVNHFSERARDFHRRMDRYREDPWDVPDEVANLNDDARKVSERIRKAHLFESTWDDWDAVVDVLDRMNRLMAGYDVEVPLAHQSGAVRPYEPEPGGSGLTRSDFAEFRLLARQLDDQASRARDAAASGTDGSYRARTVRRNIEQISDRARLLRERAEMGELTPREAVPTVDRLLDEARRTDESLRSVRADGYVREAWAQTIDTLEKMVDLARS